MQRFELVRTTDVSGMSGTGVVAEGVRFWDGHVAMRWRTATRSTTFYTCIEHVRIIHGHDGATKIKWLELNESSPFMRGGFHAALDDNENAPFGSVGGENKSEDMKAPEFIKEADVAEYLEGYRDECFAMYGKDWRTVSFSWAPVMEINVGGATL